MQVYHDDAQCETVRSNSTHTLDSPSSRTMTSARAPPPLMLDKVLLSHPSLDSSRPALANVSQSPRRVFGSHTAMTAAVAPPSSSSKLLHNTAANRPVKRSSVGLSSSPKRQAHSAVVKSTLLIMRSPPAPSKNLFKPAKRPLEASTATDGGRPSKRINSIAVHSASDTRHKPPQFTSIAASDNRAPSKAARKSNSLPKISASTTASATAETDKHIAPPSPCKQAGAEHAGTSQFKLGMPGKALSLPVRKSNLASIMSLSPSKFGLTLPKTMFAFQKPCLSTFSSFPDSSGATSAFSSTSHPTGLAPSPIRSDEHVPRPLAEPVHVLPSRSSSLESINSLIASPDRLKSMFANPFLKTQEGRAHISAALQVPSSPPSSRGASNNDSAPSSVSSTSSSRPASPMHRDDLMRRTIERSPTVCEIGHMAVTSLVGDEVGRPRQTDGTTHQQYSLYHAGLISTTSHTGEANHFVSQPSLFEKSSTQNTSSSKPLLPAASSPFKRPLSPTEFMSVEQRQVRKRSEDTSIRRQSSRQATRASLGNAKTLTGPIFETASASRKPRISAKSRQNSNEPEQGKPIYRPASAGGSAPITRPPSNRSLSAPLTTTTGSTADVFKAPTSTSTAPPPRKSAPGTAFLDEGDSGEMLDADTSVMSTSGLSSLANLQNLLTRMSRPSMSRRTSAAFPHSSTSLGSLPESTEADIKDVARSNNDSNKPFMNQSASKSRPIAALPRYAAPTSSSAARQSKGSKGPDSIELPQSTTAASRPKESRRISNGVPEVRRGSLLPVAVNAAQRLTVRPDSGNTDGLQKLPALTVSKVAKCTILQNVVAFVDVKTAEGDEAGGVFVDILRNLGARVLARPTDSITHIIYKGGRQATVQRYRAYTKEPKPFFVGVGWIVRCRETNEKADETPFFVNPDTIDNGVLLGTGGQGQNNKIVQPMGLSSGNVGKGLNANRRKTLEPKVLFPDAKKASSALPRGQQTLHAFSVFRHDDSQSNSSSSQGGEIERARQRSLRFAPRIGSPLKQRAFNAIEHDEDAMQEDM